MSKLYCLIILTLLSSCAEKVFNALPQGPQGVRGNDGVDAKPCVAKAVTGGVELTCPGQDTQFIANGAEGDAGQMGATGPKGSTGAAGQDATPVTMVALCGGQQVSPSAFAEYAMCIQGDLYGTYWDGHNAWTTKLPPGNYSSTSTTLPCNLTVGPNCTVTH